MNANDELLMHYGVKGMKLGVHRARSQHETKTRKQKVYNAAIKGAKVISKVRAASLADDIFYGGAGKKVLKSFGKMTWKSAQKYENEKAKQRANAALGRIGTKKLKHVYGDVYEWTM